MRLAAEGAVSAATPPAPDPFKGQLDVSITPNGKFALVRREGSAEIGIVDLATSARTTVALTGPVTDLDVADTGDRAVAVVRDTSHAAILSIPGSTPQVDLAITGKPWGRWRSRKGAGSRFSIPMPSR